MFFFSELSGIIGVTIALDGRTMDYSTGDPKGKIVCIGTNYPNDIKSSDLVLVTNHGDDDLYLN